MRTTSTRTNTKSPMTGGLIFVYVLTVVFIIFSNLSFKGSRQNIASKLPTPTNNNNSSTKAALVSYKLP